MGDPADDKSSATEQKSKSAGFCSKDSQTDDDISMPSNTIRTA